MLTSTDIIKAEKNGIGVKTLRKRIYYGWTKERAISEPVREKSKWLSVARNNGISPQTYYSRIYRNGWSKERAATEPVKQKGKRDRDGKG